MTLPDPFLNGKKRLVTQERYRDASWSLPVWKRRQVLLEGHTDSSCSHSTWNRPLSSSIRTHRFFLPSYEYMERKVWVIPPIRTQGCILLPAAWKRRLDHQEGHMDSSSSIPVRKTCSPIRKQGCILLSCWMEKTISSTISRTQDIIFFPSYMKKYEERDIWQVLPSLLVISIQNYGGFRMKLAGSTCWVMVDQGKILRL